MSARADGDRSEMASASRALYKLIDKRDAKELLRLTRDTAKWDEYADVLHDHGLEDLSKMASQIGYDYCVLQSLILITPWGTRGKSKYADDIRRLRRSINTAPTLAKFKAQVRREIRRLRKSGDPEAEELEAELVHRKLWRA